MMFVTTAVLSLYIYVSFGACPNHLEDEDIIEDYVIKEDPFQYIKGQSFSDVWVKDYYTTLCKCSYTEYTPQDDGSILQKAHYIHETGVEVATGEEYMKKTERAGIFTVNGIHQTTNKEYTGKSYVFFADETVLANFACEDNADNWNLAIQVRGDQKAMMNVTDSQVHKSLVKATGKLYNMYNVHPSASYRVPFNTYRTDSLCSGQCREYHSSAVNKR